MADIPASARTKAVLPLSPDYTSAKFERDGDKDWFRVSLQKGINYAFSSKITGTPSSDDYAFMSFQLRNPSGKVVRTGGGADNYDGYQFGFEYRPSATGVYFLEAIGEGAADYGIRAARDAAPDLRTTAEIEIGETNEVSIFYAGDIDVYRVDLIGGETYDFAAAADDGGVGLSLLASDGDVLVPSGGGTIEGFEAPTSGRYFLRAVDDQDTWSYEYTISAALAGDEPGPQVIRLTEGDDQYDDSGDQPVTVFGLGGDDDIFAFNQGSVVDGGDGDDFLAGGKEARGGAGGDWIDIVADVTDGGPGDDRLDLFIPSRNQVTGGTGRDTFMVQNGGGPEDADVLIDFQPGEDVISFDQQVTFASGDTVEPWSFIGTQDFNDTRQIRYEAADGRTLIEADENGDGTGDYFLEIPRQVTLTSSDFRLGVPTGPGADSFAGTLYADAVDGLGGNDVLNGAAGIDVLDGGVGNDQLGGGTGRDDLRGWIGDDTILGGPGDDRVTGYDGADNVQGDAGDDEVFGDGDNDTARGGDGRDSVFGGAGADAVYGDSGNDLLAGGEGPPYGDDFQVADRLWGGAGNDTFLFVRNYGFGTLDAGADIIEDFVPGDVINVSEIDASQGTAGDQKFTFIGRQAFSDSRQLRVAREGGNTVVQGSTNLGTAPEFEVVVRGDVALAAGSFIL
jgi:Ca2+-binding RTX toxin-like protein